MNASYGLVLVAAAAGQTPPTQAVLLDDLTVLEGQVQAGGGMVQVTPAVGSPRMVKAKQILFAGADRPAVYAYLAERVPTKTAADHVKMANWCDRAGLADRAAVHAKSAAGLAPGDADVAALARKLGEKATAAPTGVVQASAVVAKPTPVTVDLPAAARVGFGPKVQPILMNLCANCHAAKEYAGAFRLSRVSEGYANPEASATNLRAVAGQLNPADPLNSPLLTKAVTPHGGQTKPALVGREHPAFAHLERWVRTAVPVPTQPVVAAVPPPLPEPAKLPRLAKAEPVAPPPPPPTPPVVAVAPKPLPPKPIANPNDPFDPAAFGRLPAGR